MVKIPLRDGGVILTLVQTGDCGGSCSNCSRRPASFDGCCLHRISRKRRPGWFLFLLFSSLSVCRNGGDNENFDWWFGSSLNDDSPYNPAGDGDDDPVAVPVRVWTC